MKSPYTPSPLALAKGFVLALTDVLPDKVDALFWHGSPFHDHEMDGNTATVVANALNTGKTDIIVLNGLTAEECKRRQVCHLGVEPWEALLTDRGVSMEKTIRTGVALHTADEARLFLAMAKERGWARLALTTQPHHQLRCFMTTVAIMREMDFWPQVYNLAGTGVAWTRPITKNLLGGGKVNGTFGADHIGAELERIIAYATPPESKGPKYTCHGTIEDALDYVVMRDTKKP